MPWGPLGQGAFALLVYPGLVASVLFGLAAEAAWGRLFARRRRSPRDLWRTVRGGGVRPAEAAAALLALLGASQLALPFNPVSPTERSVLVTAVAVLAAGWLLRPARDGVGGPEARVLAAAEGCWLVALMAPALVSQSLRPQVLGAVVVASQLPLKLVAAALYLVCLPVLLGLLPDAGEGADGGRPRALLLWLPACGLFASVYLPAPGDPLLAVLAYAAATVGAAAAACLVTAALVRWRLISYRALYLRLALALALVALVLAAIVEVAT
jgi:hypothetical protein